MSKILVLLVFIASCTQNDFDKRIKNHNINIQFESTLDLVSENNRPIILTGKNAEVTLKLNIISTQKDIDPMSLVKRNISLLKNQYDFRTVPYPGQITNSSDCGNNFYPQFLKHNFSYIKTFANERMTYILCNSDKKTFDVYTAYFLDQKSNNLIISEVFTKKSNFNIEEFYEKYFKNVKNLTFE